MRTSRITGSPVWTPALALLCWRARVSAERLRSPRRPRTRRPPRRPASIWQSSGWKSCRTKVRSSLPARRPGSRRPTGIRDHDPSPFTGWELSWMGPTSSLGLHSRAGRQWTRTDRDNRYAGHPVDGCRGLPQGRCLHRLRERGPRDQRAQQQGIRARSGRTPTDAPTISPSRMAVRGPNDWSLVERGARMKAVAAVTAADVVPTLARAL